MLCRGAASRPRIAAASSGVVARACATLLLVLLAALATGCGAPVYHVVRSGETLYSISFRYGKDYHQMAQWNDLAEPYRLSPGQHVRIIPPRKEAFAPRAPLPGASGQPPPVQRTPATQAAPAPAMRPQAGAVEVYGLDEAPKAAPAAPAAPKSAKEAAAENLSSGWQWPTARVPARSAMTSATSNKGIDIAGERGEAVRSAAAGRVVYSGGGIPHYGNLLIIKHDEHYLSAYAHNDRLLVGEGDLVSAGQTIAEMGDSGTGTSEVKLHFEIRRDGVPVDPLKYLP